MKIYATAAALLISTVSPALTQTTSTEPVIDANGVSTTDHARPVSTMSKDINSPYNQVRYAPRNHNKMKGAPGGGGLPENGLSAGGGGPSSKPRTKVEHN